jgi:magnesium-transporting ATPase (P-type)
MLAIVTDMVAFEDLATPRHWDVRKLVELAVFLGIANAVLAFGLMRAFQGQSAQDLHVAWFLFLGFTGLLVLFAVRNKGWFYSRPWPSGPILAAIGAAFVVIVALVNIPETRTLLHFGRLSAAEQIAIGAYSVLYLLIASALQVWFQRSMHKPIRG